MPFVFHLVAWLFVALLVCALLLIAVLAWQWLHPNGKFRQEWAKAKADHAEFEKKFDEAEERIDRSRRRMEREQI